MSEQIKHTAANTEEAQSLWRVMVGQIKDWHHLSFVSPVSFLPLETTLDDISNNSSTESEWCWRAGRGVNHNISLHTLEKPRQCCSVSNESHFSVTMSHPSVLKRKEKLWETFALFHQGWTTTAGKSFSERDLNLIRVSIEVWMIVMDWPVIWDFLSQAKVSHHGRAHAALPAHQAVLHRGSKVTHNLLLSISTAMQCFIELFICY